MKLLYVGKDGGPDPTVWGCLLKFVGQSREAHALSSMTHGREVIE